MDYVLFGMGYGATLMLLGWALRTFGPQRKYSNRPPDDDTTFLVERRFWIRFIQGLGGAIAIAGTTMVLMTFVVVLVNPDDSTGTTIALAIWAFVMLAIILWCYLYVRHYGLTGIWSRQQGYGLGDGSNATLTTRRNGATSPGGNMTEYGRQGTAQTQPDPVDALSTSPAAGPEPSAVAAVDADDTSEPAEANAESAQAEPGSDPVYDFGDITDTTVPAETGGRAEALRRLRERQARARRSTNR